MRADVYPNPLDHPDTNKFLRAVTNAPGDPMPRMEFADWLEEGGYQNAATGQRWAAKNNKYPVDSSKINEPQFAAAKRHGLNASGWYEQSGPGGDQVMQAETLKHRTSNPIHRNMLQAYGRMNDLRFRGKDPTRTNGPYEQPHEAVFLDTLHTTKWDHETGEPAYKEKEV